jgi:hypothetical protein
VLYYRVPRLLDALALARDDGRYARLLKSLARVELLILDDLGLAPLLGVSRPGENHAIGDVEVGLRVGVGLVESFQFAPAVVPLQVDDDRPVHDRQRHGADCGHRGRGKSRERAGLAIMVSRNFAAPAMPGIQHGAQRAVEGETEIVAFVDQQRSMLAVNGVVGKSVSDSCAESNFVRARVKWGDLNVRHRPFHRNTRRRIKPQEDRAIKLVIISLLLLGGFIALSTMEANAFVCARGLYRAGCVGAGGGAVVVRRPYVAARGVYGGRRIYR